MQSSIFLPIVPRQGVAQVTPPWVVRKNKKLPSCDYQILGRYLSAYLCKTMISLLLLNNSPDSYSQGGSSISHNSTKVTKQACPTRTTTFGRSGMSDAWIQQVITKPTLCRQPSHVSSVKHKHAPHTRMPLLPTTAPRHGEVLAFNYIFSFGKEISGTVCF